MFGDHYGFINLLSPSKLSLQFCCCQLAPGDGRRHDRQNEAELQKPKAT